MWLVVNAINVLDCHDILECGCPTLCEMSLMSQSFQKSAEGTHLALPLQYLKVHVGWGSAPSPLGCSVSKGQVPPESLGICPFCFKVGGDLGPHEQDRLHHAVLTILGVTPPPRLHLCS